MIVMGHQIGKALCDALQLPEQTKSFVLRAQVGEAVTIECEYYPDVGADFTAALTEFNLVRKIEQAPCPEPVNFDEWMRARTEAAHAKYMWRHAEGGVDYSVSVVDRLLRGMAIGRP